MTTISMNAMSLAYGHAPRRAFAFPKFNPALVATMSEITDTVMDRAVEFIGGIVLASIPFSFLAWMFIAN